MTGSSLLIASELGALRSVKVLDRLDSDATRFLLLFDGGNLLIEAAPMDDSISISQGHRDDPGEDVSHLKPWSEVVGATPLWSWNLTNDHGFVDGYQLQFHVDPDDFTIQFIVAASALAILRVAPISHAGGQTTAAR
jgi:hypothetical protein